MLARGILGSGQTRAVSPFDLSRTLPVGGGLLVPYSLSGSPVIKQLMQMVAMVPGQVGGFSQCAPLTLPAYGAWPGWVASVRFPNTASLWCLARVGGFSVLP